MHPEHSLQDWRDPYAWQEGDDWWMVLGGHVLQDDPDVPRLPASSLYKSNNLRDWVYQGSLCTGMSGGNEIIANRNPLSGDKPGEVKTGVNWECPNFFPLDQTRDIYCLVVSPYHRVIANVGTYRDHQFAPGRWKVLDHGGSFYATNTFLEPSGRLLLVGWVREGGTGGWDGLTSLPRVLSVGDDIQLRMVPAPELAALREDHVHICSLPVGADGSIKLASVTGCEDFLANSGRRLEIIAQFEVSREVCPNEGEFGFRFFPPQDVNDPLSRELGINYEESMLYGGNNFGYVTLTGLQTFNFQIFMDNSVLETFLNESECLTSRFHPTRNAIPDIELFATMDGVRLNNLDMWTLKSTWNAKRGYPS
jgi:beta-fructofuranosidase